MKKYYSLANKDNVAELYIYGDITSYEFLESDVSSYNLSRQLRELDVETINVYINSYGGEVGEGLAIHNSLVRHKAKVITHDDGFAASIAAVVFMAGDERIMTNASLLFIHNAWTMAAGNANQFRKEADDLETITAASIAIFMEHINITEEALKAMLDAEKWLLPKDALEMGFATSIVGESSSKNASQSVKKTLFEMLVAQQAIVEPIPEPIVEPIPEPEPVPEPEPTPEPILEPTPVPEPEPTPEPAPQENKTQKFINALMR